VRSDKTPEEQVAEQRRMKKQVQIALVRVAQLHAALTELENHYRTLPRRRAE